jgi:hypothetical protein
VDAEANGIVVQGWTADIATGLSAGTAYYFNVLVRNDVGNATAYASGVRSTSASGTQIIADHTVVSKYDTIPQCWIDQVKKMWLDYPGESHSKGNMIGLSVLDGQDSRFAVDVTTSGRPEAYTNQHVRASRTRGGCQLCNELDLFVRRRGLLYELDSNRENQVALCLLQRERCTGFRLRIRMVLGYDLA